MGDMSYKSVSIYKSIREYTEYAHHEYYNEPKCGHGFIDCTEDSAFSLVSLQDNG